MLAEQYFYFPKIFRIWNFGSFRSFFFPFFSAIATTMDLIDGQLPQAFIPDERFQPVYTLFERFEKVFL